MNTSDYQILATSERYRPVADFWRRQLAAVDDGPALRASRRETVQRRESQTVLLSAGAVRTIHSLSSDPLSRFTVVAAGFALAAGRYFNRTTTLLRTPLVQDEAE